MVSRGRRQPRRSDAADEPVVLQVRLPAARLDQLMLLADRDGTLATAVVTDWVLDHLDHLDPDGDYLPVPAVQGACGNDLASVTRLPVMSGMSQLPGAGGRPVGVSAVIPLRPGSDCR